jgi:prevent-host-death family protein
MKRATISQAKNKLSELLRAVRRGETVLILDRNTPVAKLVPVYSADEDEDGDDRLASLVREGHATPARKRLDVKRFFSLPRPKLPPGVSAIDALLADREESL